MTFTYTTDTTPRDAPTVTFQVDDIEYTAIKPKLHLWAVLANAIREGADWQDQAQVLAKFLNYCMAPADAAALGRRLLDPMQRIDDPDLIKIIRDLLAHWGDESRTELAAMGIDPELPTKPVPANRAARRAPTKKIEAGPRRAPAKKR